MNTKDDALSPAAHTLLELCLLCSSLEQAVAKSSEATHIQDQDNVRRMTFMLKERAEEIARFGADRAAKDLAKFYGFCETIVDEK
jgi:hypothetical protein